FMFVRPVVGAAQYRMPLDGLWLCGAGAHPGGGISGAAGRNAARMILDETASCGFRREPRIQPATRTRRPRTTPVALAILFPPLGAGPPQHMARMERLYEHRCTVRCRPGVLRDS